MMKKDRYIRMKNWLFVSTLQNWIKEIKWIHLQGCSYTKKMHVGWKVRWAGMVATNTKLWDTERENSKQVLRTIFYLNRVTFHRATWESGKLFYSNFFSSRLCSTSKFDRKWFTSESFLSIPFSYRMIADLLAKIQLAITSDPADKFYHRLVVNSNPVSLFFCRVVLEGQPLICACMILPTLIMR